MKESPNASAARAAIDAAGGPAAVALHLGITAPAVMFWKKRGVPPHQAIAMEKLSGISRHVLRPDIYPSGDFAHSQDAP